MWCSVILRENFNRIPRTCSLCTLGIRVENCSLFASVLQLPTNLNMLCKLCESFRNVDFFLNYQGEKSRKWKWLHLRSASWWLRIIRANFLLCHKCVQELSRGLLISIQIFILSVTIRKFMRHSVIRKSTNLSWI